MRGWVRFAVAMLCLLPVTLVVARSEADAPLRILIYGDSMTQGSSGDWTWRYFVAQHLRDAGTAVDFVGPRHGLHPLSDPGGDAGLADDQDYADPGFDSDSGAVWGQALTWPTYDLANTSSAPDLVADYAPDIVVALIGQNDLGFLQRTPDELAAAWRQKIAAARQQRPGIDLVLVQVPGTWYDGVTAYNQQLLALSDELDTAESRVVTTELARLDRAADTWDGTHPAASGEVKIARVVDDALARLGVGRPSGMLPVVANGPNRVPALQVVPGVGKAELRWDDVPGVNQIWVEQRDLTVGGRWERFPIAFGVGAGSWTAGGLTDRHRYQFRLRPGKGEAISAVLTSAEVEVIPGPRPTAPRPAVPAVDAGGRVGLAWPAVAGATGYVVALRDLTHGSVKEWSVSKPAWSVGDLVSGRSYELRVRADNGPIVGGTSSVTRFTVPLVGAVARVTATSPRRDKVRTTAATVPFATGYRLEISPVRTCRALPARSTFRRVSGDVRKPSLSFATGSKAVWVRWSAVRGGVPGPATARSAACLRVR